MGNVCVLVWVIEDVEVVCLVLNDVSPGVFCVVPVPGRCLGVEVTTQYEIGCVCKVLEFGFIVCG